MKEQEKQFLPVEKIDWANYIEKYGVPTVLKEELLKPYFENINLEEPILDIGCGTGYFSELLSHRDMSVVGIDPNIELKENDHFKFIKADFLDARIIEKFKTILLINVLSVLSKEKRIQFMEKIYKTKDLKGKVYLIIMNSDLYKNNFNSKKLSVKKINSEVVSLKFKSIDGSYITFNDYIITENEISDLVKNTKMKIVENTDFKSNEIEQSIYKLFVLE